MRLFAKKLSVTHFSGCFRPALDLSLDCWTILRSLESGSLSVQAYMSQHGTPPLPCTDTKIRGSHPANDDHMVVNVNNTVVTCHNKYVNYDSKKLQLIIVGWIYVVLLRRASQGLNLMHFNKKCTFFRHFKTELKKVGSKGSMLPEHPMFFPQG